MLETAPRVEPKKRTEGEMVTTTISDNEPTTIDQVERADVILSLMARLKDIGPKLVTQPIE